jgi:two-component system nitrogen regulation response regulator NtrX
VPKGKSSLEWKRLQKRLLNLSSLPVPVSEETRREVKMSSNQLPKGTEESSLMIRKLQERLRKLEGRTEDQFWFVSRSSAMQRVNDQIASLRKESLRGTLDEGAVLILGDAGTGQEGIARMIHAGSRRAKGPWVSVNGADFSSTSPEAFDAQVFGTSQQLGLLTLAEQGTFYIENLLSLDKQHQQKLLKVIQEKTFDVRVIVGDTSDFRTKAKSGAVLDELFQAISQTTIQLPALRERKEDIVPLAKQFAEKTFKMFGSRFEGFSPEAEKALQEFSWPGNLFELKNVIERTALCWEGEERPVQTNDLIVTAKAQSVSQSGNSGPQLHLVPNPGDEASDQGYTAIKKKWCDSFEKDYLVHLLNRNGGNVSAAARESKLDRSNFLRLLRRHGLKAQEYRKAAA